MSPIVVLRSTLLPVPEVPTSDKVSPSLTVRFTPARTGTSKRLWMSMYSITERGSVQEEGREGGVEHEHADDHEDDGGGGVAPHSLGAAVGDEPHVQGDDRDDEPERERLGQRVEKVPGVPEHAGAVE